MADILYQKKTIPTVEMWDDVREDMLTVLLATGFPRKKAVSFLVAAEEMFANIAMYAFPCGYGKDDMCEVSLSGIKDGAEIVLKDSGIEFDPTLLPKRRPIKSAKGVKPGGFGISMARDMTDRLEYVRDGKCNVLTMIKYINKGE